LAEVVFEFSASAMAMTLLARISGGTISLCSKQQFLEAAVR
jgi:hypothetical protein